jgi:hypothetical protein
MVRSRSFAACATPHPSPLVAFALAIDRIADWMYFKDEKFHGAFTTRAILPFMKPDARAEMEGLLAPE